MNKQPRSISVTRFNYIIREDQEDELDDEGIPSHYTELDQAGRTLKEASYNADGLFEEMYEYAYGEDGRVLREAYYTAEDELAEEKVFHYSEEGRITHATKTYQDGSVDTIRYEYDADGHLVRRTTTNDEGEVDQIESFTWEDGVLVGQEVTDADGDPIQGPDLASLPSNRTEVVRNDKGQVVSEEEYTDRGELMSAIRRTYTDDDFPDTVDVYLDGLGRRVTRHYVLQYEYTFFE